MRRNPPARWVLPEIIDPARKCVVLRIPNEKYHIAAFNGALQSLASGYKWADDLAHTAKDVALVWRDVIDTMAANDCFIQNVRWNNCILEITFDNETWFPVDGDLTSCFLTPDTTLFLRDLRFNAGALEYTRNGALWTAVTNLDNRYIKKSPTGNENTITPATTTTNALIVQALVGQQGNLQQWNNSAGNPITVIDANSRLITQLAYITQIRRNSAIAGTLYFDANTTNAIRAVAELTGQIAHRFVGDPAGSADIVQWLLSNNTLLSGVDRLGRFRNALTTGIPTDTPTIKGAQTVDATAEKFYIHMNSGWKEIGAAGQPGADGASAELRKTATAIQWRQDDDDPTWADLVQLSEITGPQGEPGADGGVTDLYITHEAPPAIGNIREYDMFCRADEYVMLPCEIYPDDTIEISNGRGWWTDQVIDLTNGTAVVPKPGYDIEGNIAETGIVGGDDATNDPLPSAKHMCLVFALPQTFLGLDGTGRWRAAPGDIITVNNLVTQGKWRGWFHPNCQSLDGNSGGVHFHVKVTALHGAITTTVVVTFDAGTYPFYTIIQGTLYHLDDSSTGDQLVGSESQGLWPSVRVDLRTERRVLKVAGKCLKYSNAGNATFTATYKNASMVTIGSDNLPISANNTFVDCEKVTDISGVRYVEFLFNNGNGAIDDLLVKYEEQS